jgi:putative ATPase
MKTLDYGKNYRYAHHEPEAYAAAVDYFPDNMTPPEFYMPTQRGLEGKITEKLAHLHDLDQRELAKNNKK